MPPRRFVPTYYANKYSIPFYILRMAQFTRFHQTDGDLSSHRMEKPKYQQKNTRWTFEANGCKHFDVHCLLVHCSFSFNKNFVSLGCSFLVLMVLLLLLLLCYQLLPPKAYQNLDITCVYFECNTNPWFPLFLAFSFSTVAVSESWFSFASFSSVMLNGTTIGCYVCGSTFFSLLSSDANFGQMRMTLFELNCRKQNTVCCVCFLDSRWFFPHSLFIFSVYLVKHVTSSPI